MNWHKPEDKLPEYEEVLVFTDEGRYELLVYHYGEWFYNPLDEANPPKYWMEIPPLPSKE